MKPINLAELQAVARELAHQGVSEREIARRTGLTYHHVFSATRPGYAARKAREVKERRWLAAGLGRPKRNDRRESGGAARWRGKHPVPAHAHPLVRTLIEELNQQNRLLGEVARRAGVRASTVSTWRYNRLPRLDLLEALLNVLGLELVILPKIGSPQPELHAAATDILDAAYAAARAQKAVILAEHTPAQGEARRTRERAMDALMRIVEAAHV